VPQCLLTADHPAHPRRQSGLIDRHIAFQLNLNDLCRNVELLQAERRRAPRAVLSLRVLRSAEHEPQPIQVRREALRESEVHRGAAKVYMRVFSATGNSSQNCGGRRGVMGQYAPE
jgi:hypothetical protein